MGEKKQELFLDSLEKEIPTGIISLRNHGNRIEVIDGLHRLKMFNRILRGEGVYFDVENERLTLEGGNFDYSEYQKEDLTVLFIAKKYEEIELLSKLANSIQKVYNLRIPFIEYEGTDEEVRQAFERINMKGVQFTPQFTQIGGEIPLSEYLRIK